jgi:hypothetical protein
MMFTIISTGAPDTPPEALARCRATVAAQRTSLGGAVDFEHLVLCNPKPHFQNLVEVIEPLPDDRIVASLDADDWLNGPSALEIVARYFGAGAWVTYGSFTFADGRPGSPSTAYAPEENVRQAPWRATHLKCFRAGLFKRIRHEHLRGPDGAWLEHARDLALMFPLLEMAGPERSAHVSEPIYVYNFANSTEFRGPESVRADERACVRYVRGLPAYERLP